jgi:hypothetical protein
MAAAVLASLKGAGHVLVERGGDGAVVRELEALLAPILPRLVARAARAPVSGEVTSTFGDEATDEAVEDLVAELREAVVENDHVEDVFAEDRELERAIFRALRDELLEAAQREDTDEATRVPISVRLDTLGYVAATAARRADAAVVRAALERAAKHADGELETFEPTSRIALFAMDDEDPDHRLEVEEAVAEELTSLVAEGEVDLPTIERTVHVGRDLSPGEWRAARDRVDAVARRLSAATGVPASWRPDGGDAVRLSCTPLSEKDAELVDEIATAFQRDVAALLSAPDEPPRSARGRAPDEAPRSARGRAPDEAPRSARGRAPDEAPRSARGRAPDEAPRSARGREAAAGSTPRKRASKVVPAKKPGTDPQARARSKAPARPSPVKRPR